MDVQIGDTVLVQPAKGIQFPAMVLHIGFQLKIDCVGFTLAGHTRFLVSVPYVESIKTLEGLDYWNFRPSQKEPPPVVKAEPNNPAQFNISTEKQSNLFWDMGRRNQKTQAERFSEWSKCNQPDYAAEIKSKDGIKLHPSLLKPPDLGTFEWALVALKNGHKVRKLGWYEPDAAVKIDHSIFRLLHSGCLFIPSSHDLLATDWVLA